MSLTSYQAAPPCNEWGRKVLTAVGTVNVNLGFFQNSRLPAAVARGVLTDSLSGITLNQNQTASIDRKAAHRPA